MLVMRRFASEDETFICGFREQAIEKLSGFCVQVISLYRCWNGYQQVYVITPAILSDADASPSARRVGVGYISAVNTASITEHHLPKLVGFAVLYCLRKVTIVAPFA